MCRQPLGDAFHPKRLGGSGFPFLSRKASIRLTIARHAVDGTSASARSRCDVCSSPGGDARDSDRRARSPARSLWPSGRPLAPTIGSPRRQPGRPRTPRDRFESASGRESSCAGAPRAIAGKREPTQTGSLRNPGRSPIASRDGSRLRPGWQLLNADDGGEGRHPVDRREFVAFDNRLRPSGRPAAPLLVRHALSCLGARRTAALPG